MKKLMMVLLLVGCNRTPQQHAADDFCNQAVQCNKFQDATECYAALEKVDFDKAVDRAAYAVLSCTIGEHKLVIGAEQICEYWEICMTPVNKYWNLSLNVEASK